MAKTLSPANNLRMLRRKSTIPMIEAKLKLSDGELAKISASGKTGKEQRERLTAELETLKKRVL